MSIIAYPFVPDPFRIAAYFLLHHRHDYSIGRTILIFRVNQPDISILSSRITENTKHGNGIDLFNAFSNNQSHYFEQTILLGNWPRHNGSIVW